MISTACYLTDLDLVKLSYNLHLKYLQLPSWSIYSMD